jgi:adenosylcobalamin-dependent ribonucleoside-triphosphate reductase
VISACESQLNCGFDEDEKSRLRYYFLKLKGSVAGRFWWQLGTHTIDRFGLLSLQNCAFVVVDNPIVPFTWTMDALALGAGVGYNIQRKNVEKLPMVREWFTPPTRVDHGGADFIIPDSREGWVRFLAKTLKAAFLSERKEKGTFTYSTQVVRGKGTPIKGFGGVASGPEDLCWGIGKISEVLMHRRGKKVRPIDCLDIMNIIGHIIVAGNVRRSAQIAIGDPDDIEFLLAKRFDIGNVPAWRAMSNNSVACDDLRDLHEYFWDTYQPDSQGHPREPYGLINLRLSRKVGRLNEPQYPDPDVQGYNPCGEQSLNTFETCCLSEIFLPNIESKDELLDIATLLYRINKHSLLLPCHHPETEEVVHRNMRMGVGMTGVMQATEQQLGWLDECYEHLREYDYMYSEVNEMRPSIKLTTVKPSGTLSLLPGVTPGVHPGYAQYMFRRIRIASDHALTKVCRDNGYPVEYVRNFDGSEDYNTVVVTFPFSYPEGTILAKDMTALEQLKWVKRMQETWSDNSVSCTVYYRKEELPEIKDFLMKHYRNNFKTLSFLLHSEHGFKQAPYEEITKEQYDDLVSKTKLISGISSAEFEGGDECPTGVCPVR